MGWSLLIHHGSRVRRQHALHMRLFGEVYPIYTQPGIKHLA